MKISKITLGTAQLGLKYGIANINGKPDYNTSINLLNFALMNGINTIDTAPDYGNSEKIIGSFISSTLKEKSKDLIIISKFPPFRQKKNFSFDNIYAYIKNQLIKSLKRLNREKIQIYLLHHAPDIYIKNGIIIECLNQIKNEGLIEKLGISSYNPNDIKASLEFKEIDVVQVTMNVFDNRLINTGLLDLLRKKNKMIFARSIYLQGLFFLSPNNLPKHLKIAREPLIKLRNISKEFNIEIAKLAFLYVRDLPQITSLVIGAEKEDQILNNLKYLKEQPLHGDVVKRIVEEFSEMPEKLIMPFLWNE